MQQTKLFPGSAILTFHIHKLWRSFLRIVTLKDEDPFSWRQSFFVEKCYIVYSSGIISKFGRYSKGLNFTNGINYELVYIMSVNFLDINDMQNMQEIL